MIAGCQRRSTVCRHLCHLLAANPRPRVWQEVSNQCNLLRHIVGVLRFNVALSHVRLLGRQSVCAVRHEQRVSSPLPALPVRPMLPLSPAATDRQTRHADQHVHHDDRQPAARHAKHLHGGTAQFCRSRMMTSVRGRYLSGSNDNLGS
jgi:hypothetical protein